MLDPGRIWELTQMHQSGAFEDDPQVNAALNKALDGIQISDIVGDYFDVGYGAKGKWKLNAKPQPHGLSGSVDTLRAMIFAERQARTGDKFEPVANPGNTTDDIVGMLEAHFNKSEINKLGNRGLRQEDAKNTPADVKKRRAAVLAGNLGQGYDPETGALYNGVGLDAGHREAHVLNPELSADPENIRFQNKYENRVQGQLEKRMKPLERDYTDGELSDAMFKGIINKVTEDVVLPRKGSTEYFEYFDPINLKQQEWDPGGVEKYFSDREAYRQRHPDRLKPLRMAGSRLSLV